MSSLGLIQALDVAFELSSPSRLWGSLEVEPYAVSHLSRITCLANQGYRRE